MSSQLRIDGSEKRLDGLTDRQRLALDYIAANQPVSSDELGAVLHADRVARGGRGHVVDVRCTYCADEGSDMGRALKAKGLVFRPRKGGWQLAGSANPLAQPVDRGLQTDEIPY